MLRLRLRSVRVTQVLAQKNMSSSLFPSTLRVIDDFSTPDNLISARHAYRTSTIFVLESTTSLDVPFKGLSEERGENMSKQAAK